MWRRNICTSVSLLNDDYRVEEEMETDQTTEDNPAVESKPTETKPIPVAESEPEPEPEWVAKLKSIQSILSGELTISTNQDFLIRNNHTDLQILKNIKVSFVLACFIYK